MVVSLYLHLQKFRVAFYTIDLETIVIYNLNIQETLIASEFLHNSIGSNHIAPNWSPFPPKIQPKYSMEVSQYLHLEEFRVAFILYQFRQLKYIPKQYWAKWNSDSLLGCVTHKKPQKHSTKTSKFIWNQEKITFILGQPFFYLIPFDSSQIEPMWIWW